MRKIEYRLTHGEHNERLCDNLRVNQEFPDWTITTAFYATLHFVTYEIFPFKYKVGDKQLVFENIDDWFRFKGSKTSKHQLLSELVEIYCPSVYDDYKWLLKMSHDARYKSYQHDKHIVDRAISIMKRINRLSQS